VQITKYMAVPLLAGLLSASGPALPAEAHVHGQGHLDVAIDEGVLTIHLESPLDSFVGFEHAARNEKERAAVQRMARTLRTEPMFVPSAAAGCRLKQISLSSPVLDPALLGESRPAKEEGGESGHAELIGEYVYACEKVAALKGLEVRLFTAFPALKRLDAQVAGPTGQSGARLTKQSPNLSW
jgi:hypothetical protein